MPPTYQKLKDPRIAHFRPNLHYILNQKLVPQKQFEKFDPRFTPERFLHFEALIDTRKNHDAFT